VDERAVDGETVRADELVLDPLGNHAVEELAVQIMEIEPLAVHAERLLRASVLLQRQVEEPALAGR
jgi:hypothetical protein